MLCTHGQNGAGMRTAQSEAGACRRWYSSERMCLQQLPQNVLICHIAARLRSSTSARAAGKLGCLPVASTATPPSKSAAYSLPVQPIATSHSCTAVMAACAALQRPAGLLGAPAGLGGRPLPAPRLPGVSARRGRGPLRCRAHQGHHHAHDHPHQHGEKHAHSGCSRGHSHEHHAHSHGCGHDHGGPDPSNPAHRLLSAAFDATRLTPVAAWLESSMAASIGKVALFLVAAGAAGWASSSWATSAAAAAAARALSTAATAGVYVLAGLPAAVDLSYDLTAGKIDTHVLMNLAVLGTLATGHALEVGGLGAVCWAVD